jgi:hypothetical protein
MCTSPGALGCRSMNLLDLLNHLANLLLPGLVTGGIAATLTKLLWRRDLAAVSFWRLASFAASAGMAVSMAGLVVFGSDGRMLTYLFMVVGCALALAWGGWARRPASS